MVQLTLRILSPPSPQLTLAKGFAGLLYRGRTPCAGCKTNPNDGQPSSVRSYRTKRSYSPVEAPVPFRFALYLSSALALICLLPSAAYASDVSFHQTTTPGTLSQILHAELNNDGREDLVYLKSDSSGFYVQLSTGDGTYAAPTFYPMPSGEFSEQIGAIADFTGDGNADIIVDEANDAGAFTAHLWANNRSGAFTDKGPLPLGKAVLTGDFNHDGNMDLVVQNTGSITVWFGNGKGGFTEGPTTQITNYGNFFLGDFDGDGIADIAISDILNYDSFEVLYGDNRGDFTPVVISVPGGSFNISVGDVNSDGKMDIIAANFYPTATDRMTVFYGDASRTFSSRSAIPISHCFAGGLAPAVADVNGDGISDLVVPEADCGSTTGETRYIGILTRKPNSSYNPDQIVYTAPTSSQGVVDLDVIRANHDTRPDLLAQVCGSNCGGSSNQSVILQNTSYGTFHACDAPKTFLGIWVCSPSAASASSPVDFSIAASGQVVMRKVEVWVDGKKLGEQLNGFSNYSFFDKSFSIPAGRHQVNIYAAGWDNSLEEDSFTLQVK